jgi:predicted DNA-binding ribbon-helix-helix protein
MKSAMVRHAVVVGRHKTGISLEPEFWNALREIADSRGISVARLITSINARRKLTNLSSAIRLFVLGFYREECIKRDLEVTLGRAALVTPH